MERRIFLAGCAVAAPAAALAVPVAGPGRAGAEAVELLQTRLVNADLCQSGGAAACPPSGAQLALRRDPSRAYDPAAVMVLSERGDPLGYLPPIRGQIIARLLDGGIALAARAVGDGPDPRVAISCAGGATLPA